MCAGRNLLALGAALSLLRPSDARLVGKGASLPDSLYQDVFFAYQFSSRHLANDANVATVSYTATGSSTGKRLISNPTDVEVDFAGSDSPLSPSNYANAPDLRMYPAVAGAVVPILSLPFLSTGETVVLTRETLARIFLGDIRTWNDTSIVDDISSYGDAALAAKFAASTTRIWVVVRTDGSGTSEIFTGALSKFSPSSLYGNASFETRIGRTDRPDWCEGDYKNFGGGDFGFRDSRSDSATAWGGNSGTVVCSKASHASVGLGDWEYLRGTTNDGVSAAVSQVPGAIGYSVLSEALDTGLAFASIVNLAGRATVASVDAVNYALMELGGDLDKYNNAELFDAAGALAWPIAGFTYFILRSEDASRSCRDREEMVRFFEWFYNDDSVKTSAAQLGFGTLPEFLVDRVLTEMVESTKCFEASDRSSPLPAKGTCCDADLLASSTGFTWCPVCNNGGRVAYASFVPISVKLMGPPVIAKIMGTFIAGYMNVDAKRNYEYLGTSELNAYRLYANESSPIIVFSTVGMIKQRYLSLVQSAPPTISLPFAATAVVVAYRIPDNFQQLYADVDLLGDVQNRTLTVQRNLAGVLLTGEVIAKVYLGDIAYWDDPAIVALASHPGCGDCNNAATPHSLIHVVLRSDDSDATQAFTTFLNTSSVTWATTHGVMRTFADFDTSVYESFSWAKSEVEVEATVTYEDNALGFFHYLKAATRVDVADLLVNGEVVGVSRTSLQACETDASKIEPDELSFYYDATAQAQNPPGCWPITASYAIAMAKELTATEADVDCAAQEEDAGIYHWFFESEAIIEPVEHVNAAGATPDARALALVNMELAVTCTSPAGAVTRIYEACGAGEYLDAGVQACQSCPANTYKEEFIHDFQPCQPCPEGTFSPGAGSTSADACVNIHSENKNHLGDAIRALGIALFSICLIVAFVCVVWTYVYRERQSVKFAQPEFLYFIAFGCALATSTILPLGYDDRDNAPGVVDAACVAQPWLYSMGFAITYGALFAKLERVKRIFENGASLKRVKDATFLDLLKFVAAFLLVTLAVLVVWTVVDPLHWQRDVKQRDSYGHALSSKGSCQGRNSWVYILVIVAMQVSCLAYGNYVAYITRTAPTDFQEARWIGTSMALSIQVLAIGVPVMILASDSAVTNYFVRSGILFFQYMSVLVFLFFPKMVVVFRRADIATDKTPRNQFLITGGIPRGVLVQQSKASRSGAGSRKASDDPSSTSSATELDSRAIHRSLNSDLFGPDHSTTDFGEVKEGENRDAAV